MRSCKSTKNKNNENNEIPVCHFKGYTEQNNILNCIKEYFHL